MIESVRLWENLMPPFGRLAIDTTAVTGALNWGEFAIRYRKFQKQIRWRDGPSIAYCTEAGGSPVALSSVTAC